MFTNKYNEMLWIHLRVVDGGGEGRAGAAFHEIERPECVYVIVWSCACMQ